MPVLLYNIPQCTHQPLAREAVEALSAGLTGAVNGGWQVADADSGAGVVGFAAKNDLWQKRRSLARDFWADGPLAIRSPTKATTD